MDSGASPKKGRNSKRDSRGSDKASSSPKQNDEDALQKEKASILNRIKKKLHIKKDDSNGGEHSQSSLDSSFDSNPNFNNNHNNYNNNSKRSSSNLMHGGGSGGGNGEDDDMRVYDSDDDDEPKYVPSSSDSKKMPRIGSNNKAMMATDESVEYLHKGLKTLSQTKRDRDEAADEDNDEVLMEKGEEEDFLEELASWGKLTQDRNEAERREAERLREMNSGRNGNAANQSLDQATVSAILNEKLNNLDFKKQKYLLKVLEKLERGDLRASMDPRLTTSLEGLLKKSYEIKPPAPSQAVRPIVGKEINLRLISNWGDKSHIGLTEVEVFDQAGRQITLDPGAIRVGSSGVQDDGLARLIDGQSKTINERHMWLADASHLPIDISVAIPDNNQISKIKLWNYNKTVKDSTKGVQECEIWIGGNCWWRGIVDKGCGNNVFDYATLIPLLQPQSGLPPHQPTQPHQPHQPTEQKPSTKRPQPKSTIPAPTSSSTAKPPPPSFLTADSSKPTLPRSSSNDGKKSSVQEQATRPTLAKSLPPKEDTSNDDSDKFQSKPIWLSNGADESSLKRQQDFNLDLNANTRTALEPDDSPLSSRKARPHSRHSRELAEKEQKEKVKDLPKPMVKSPSFGRDAIFGISSPSNGSPAQNPTPRRRGLSNSVADPNAFNGSNSPSISTSNASNNSNLLYSNLANLSSNNLSITSQSQTQKKRVNPLDIVETSSDYIPSFRGGEETARRKRETAYNSPAKESTKDTKDKNGIPPNFSIEQSWENLNFFNVKQMGRIKETKDGSPSTQSVTAAISSPSNPSVLSAMTPTSVSTPRNTHASSTPRSAHVALASNASAIRSPALNSNISDFSLPFLPSGQVIDITIFSTWGDPYYVGLSGIDFFDSQGKFITFPEPLRQITANPADVNELPGYGHDPRTIDKLLDGHQRSCDDLHVWLAPFTPGQKNEIKIVFAGNVSLSLIRIWNYNKSRIHSFRGAKEIEIKLDGSTIFKGQIKKAPGLLHQADEAAEYILFTQDETILSNIEQNDPLPVLPSRTDVDSETNQYIGPRPKTGDKRKIGETDMDDEFALMQLQSIHSSRADGRPTTAAIITPRAPLGASAPSNTLSPKPANSLSGSGGKSAPPDVNYPTGKQLTFKFLSTWGDKHYLGLTGITVYDQRGKPVSIPSKQLWAHPRDINDMPGAPGDDDRTLDKLVDGTNTTTSDHHMWLIPFAANPHPILRIDLTTPTTISAIRIWNYNKNVEDSFRGAKNVSISIDDVPLSADPYVFRKAPGIADFDFGQYISFANYDKRTGDTEFIGRWDKAKSCKPASAILTKLDYQMFTLPCGHILKFSFLSTCGDPHYLGLNGLEIYDWTGHQIPISAKNALAIPSSVAVLPDMKNDARVMANLFNGINDTFDDRHMWLTPYTGANVLYVVINDATAISMIKMWNYAKTPTRGVEEFELYVDDLLVYKGVLKIAPNASAGSKSFGQTILFSYEDKFIAKEKDAIYSNQSEQHVQFINDNQIVVPVKKLQLATAPPQARPSTSVGSRPM